MNAQEQTTQTTQTEYNSNNRFLAKKSDAREKLLDLLAKFKIVEAFGLAQNMTCNEFIIDLYKHQHNCTVLRTFYDWKENGYKVKKGEKGLPIFSRPKSKKNVDSTDSTDTTEKTYFFISYVFTDKQVEKINA